jgi:IS605 OrfB family transposase
MATLAVEAIARLGAVQHRPRAIARRRLRLPRRAIRRLAASATARRCQDRRRLVLAGHPRPLVHQLPGRDGGGKAGTAQICWRRSRPQGSGGALDRREDRAPRFYRNSEAKLATSQRARKTRRAKAIHCKIANRRKDFLHKASSKLAKEYGLIVVGDVSSSKLARTNQAKSVLDVGWSRFKDILSWKLRLRSGGMLLEVSERFSSQVCSECGSLPPSRPKGIADLGIREWCCDACGSIHDRDVNAARNILRTGLGALRGGAHV